MMDIISNTLIVIGFILLSAVNIGYCMYKSTTETASGNESIWAFWIEVLLVLALFITTLGG